MHFEQIAPFLQLFPHKHTLPHTQTPPMNLLGPILYKFPPPWVTQHFPANEVLKSIEK